MTRCERAFSTHVHDTYSPACCASHQLTRCYRMLRERVAANQAYLVFPAYCTLTAHIALGRRIVRESAPWETAEQGER